MQNGVVYIAFDKDRKANRIKELEYSTKSIKRIHPNLHITLFTDKDPKIKYIDNVKIVSIESTRVKQIYLYESPYDNTLYIDTDTAIVNPILDMFDLMYRFDIAATVDHVRAVDATGLTWDQYNNIPNAFPEFGGGVILFRKSQVVERFFDTWRKNYLKWKKVSGKFNDQPSFRVSLWESPDLSVYTLLPEYNIRTKKHHNITPKILHFHEMTDDKVKIALKNWGLKLP